MEPLPWLCLALKNAGFSIRGWLLRYGAVVLIRLSTNIQTQQAEPYVTSPESEREGLAFAFRKGSPVQSAFAHAAKVIAIAPGVVSKEVVKIRDLVRQLEENGWRLDRIRGSHRQYRHPERPDLRTVTVAGHLSEDVPKGTLAAILKQAGLKK